MFTEIPRKFIECYDFSREYTGEIMTNIIQYWMKKFSNFGKQSAKGVGEYLILQIRKSVMNVHSLSITAKMFFLRNIVIADFYKVKVLGIA